MSLMSRSFRKRGHDLPPLLVKLKSMLLSKADGSGDCVLVVVVLVMDCVSTSPSSFVVFGLTVTVDVAPSSSPRVVGDGEVVGFSSSSSSCSSSSWSSLRLRSSGASSATHSHFPSTNMGTELSTSSVSTGSVPAGIWPTAVPVAARAADRKRPAARASSSGHCILGLGKQELGEGLEEAMTNRETRDDDRSQNIAASGGVASGRNVASVCGLCSIAVASDVASPTGR